MSRIFTVDIGNTAAKGSVYHDYELLASKVVDNSDPDSLVGLAMSHHADAAIYCNVGGSDRKFGSRLRAELDIPVMELTCDTPLPFKVEYLSRNTLGVDRIAAAAGAVHKYGGNVLVVDAGTAVTIDLLNGPCFCGGNISPGLRLRFRSLNAFTAKLPLVRPDGDLPGLGRDTETAIRSGVVNGLVAEIADAFFEAKKNNNALLMVMTGGDADFLKPLLERKGVECQIDHDLVGLGLASIFNYNRK